MKLFTKEIEGKTVKIYQADGANLPAVFLPEFEENGPTLLEKCTEIGTPPFHLVTISNLHWDEDLSPWPSEPVVTKEDHFTGGAEAFLTLLTKRILPAAKEITGPGENCLAGYSMAGLFTLYAALHTDCFSRCVSASGSFWFPGIVDYVKAHPVNASVRKFYFSIGDKESRTRHPALSTTEENTKSLAALLGYQGVETTFELNPGNHFKNERARLAKGIRWALEG